MSQVNIDAPKPAATLSYVSNYISLMNTNLQSQTFTLHHCA